MRLNVILKRGQLLNIFHNPKIRRHQMKLQSRGKYFFVPHLMKPWSSVPQVGVNVESKKMSQFEEGTWGSLSRAVKSKDVSNAHAVRAGGTNCGVFVVFLYLTTEYLLLARAKVLSWRDLALTYCSHQVLTDYATTWLSI